MSTLTAVLDGIPFTLLLTACGFAIGVVGGVPLVLARRSRYLAARAAARAIIEVLRGIPPIVWLFIIFFGIGGGLRALSPTVAAVIGLGAISCAYLAEIYRGGLAAVDAGQWEASAALGLDWRSTHAQIIAPQVVRACVPAAATYVIGLLKDSSVAYTIGVTEILYYANNQSSLTANAIVPFLYAAVVYIILTIPCAWAARAVDARLQRRIAL